MLSSADLDQLCDIVREEASFADEHGIEYIDFEGMLRVQVRCRDLWGSELDRCFRPTAFLKLRGLGGTVEVDMLIEYIRRYVEMRKLVRVLLGVLEQNQFVLWSRQILPQQPQSNEHCIVFLPAARCLLDILVCFAHFFGWGWECFFDHKN